MTTLLHRLPLLCLAVLAWEGLATAVAVALNLPAQFGGAGTDAAAEFASRGTALSAPPLPLAVLAVAALLVARAPRPGAVAGAVLIALLGIVFTVGSLGEAVAAATPDVPKAVLVANGVIGTAIGAALVAGALGVLTGRPALRAAATR